MKTKSTVKWIVIVVSLILITWFLVLPLPSQKISLSSHLAIEPRPVYVYSESFRFKNELDACDKRLPEMVTGGYTAVVDIWIDQLHRDLMVTSEPGDAKWILVPFNFERSYQIGLCQGRTHLQRVESVLSALKSAPTYLRRNGSDHILMVGYWKFYPGYGGDDFFPYKHRSVIANMVVGRYLSYYLSLHPSAPLYGFQPVASTGDRWWIEGEDWRCTLVYPVLTISSMGNVRVQSVLQDWERERPILLYYRGHGKANCARGAQSLHEKVFQLGQHFPKERTILSRDHAPSASIYVGELSRSRFCLVFRCDDPQTSRFYDAVSAGCIPVLINDGFHLTVAPFSLSLNYASFSVSIPEAMWNSDPVGSSRFAYHWPKNRLEALLRGLIVARRVLDWRSRDSQVSKAMLLELQSDCEY